MYQKSIIIGLVCKELCVVTYKKYTSIYMNDASNSSAKNIALIQNIVEEKMVSIQSKYPEFFSKNLAKKIFCLKYKMHKCAH